MAACHCGEPFSVPQEPQERLPVRGPPGQAPNVPLGLAVGGRPGAQGYWRPHRSNPRGALAPFYSLLKRGEILREKKSKECEKTEGTCWPRSRKGRRHRQASPRPAPHPSAPRPRLRLRFRRGHSSWRQRALQLQPVSSALRVQREEAQSLPGPAGVPHLALCRRDALTRPFSRLGVGPQRAPGPSMPRGCGRGGGRARADWPAPSRASRPSGEAPSARP